MERVAPQNSDRLVSSSASLQIYGEDLDFDRLSRELDTAPTRTIRRGQLTRAGAAVDNDLWSIASPLERSSSIDQHLNWLSELVRRRRPMFHLLAKEPNVRRINLFIAATIDGDSCELRLSSSSLVVFSDLEIGLELSCVFVDLSEPGSRPTENRDNKDICLSENGKDGSRFHITLIPRHPSLKLRANMLSLGLHSIQRELFSVPLPDAESVDSQLKWLSQAYSQNKALGSELVGNIDVMCSVLTECEWESVWLSQEALRLVVELRTVLSIELRLSNPGVVHPKHQA